MPTEDDFDSIQTPAFLLADQVERQEGRHALDRPAALSRAFKASSLIAIVTAIGAAVLWVEDPVTLLASVTAPLAGNSAPQPGADEPAPAIQPTAEAPIQSAANDQSPSQSAKDAPAPDETVLAEAKESPSERAEPTSEDLLAKFQAWATEKDAQAQAASTQPVQDAPVPAVKHVASNARVPHRFMQRRARATPIRNARAEVRPQAPKRRVQRSQPESPREIDARAAQQVPAQVEQAQPFPPTFGLRN